MTETGKYDFDPDEFIVPASDTKGHSERLWLRLQPGHRRMLDSILTSRFFPYKTTGDVARHAIARHLKWLEGVAPFPSVVGQVEAIMEIMREEQFQHEFGQVLLRLEENVAGCMAKGQKKRAEALVMRVLGGVEGMPDGSWKDAYRAEIKGKFGHMLTKKAIKLLETVED